MNVLKGHTSYVYSVSFNHDSTLAISGSFDKTICIWNVVTGERMKQLKGHTAGVSSVSFNHDSTLRK